jgi:hypothetical protein
MTTMLAAPPPKITDAERTALERTGRSSSLPARAARSSSFLHRTALQAKRLALSAEGVAICEVARRSHLASNSALLATALRG